MPDATPQYSRPLHLLAWLTACSVFPLIFMGGLVTSHHAGLAVPDWPNSYGYNMFLFPPAYWQGGIFFEHTHRLLGTLVGFCSILLVLQAHAPARNPVTRRRIAIAALLSLLLTIAVGTYMLVTHNTDPMLSPTAGKLSHTLVGFASLFLVLTAAWFPRRRDERRWVRRLSLITFTAILLQGILGGLRVDLVNLVLAVIHGCFAQAVFCLCSLMVVITSRWWLSLSAIPQSAIRNPKSLTRLALTALLLVYLQLIAGATMRHFDAGLAIPDLPLAYGHLLPPTTADALPAINDVRAALNDASPDAPALNPVTLGQIWLHFTHRIGAIVVTVVLLTLITQIVRRFRQVKPLLRPAILQRLFLLTQLTLGILTVLYRKPAEVATAHVAVGALVLVTTFVLFVRSVRLYGWGKKTIITSPTPDPVGPRAVPV